MSKPNRLASEKSPYLLQHAHNPVDWFPWGDEAFAKARGEDKMIFLSIGYSTCHWCHVMERESFENPEVAALLNDLFVPVKVDREERPDIDHLYMGAVQAMTGSGGWPLSVFLTPEGKPVTGGTYFPPEDKWGRPGMKTILPRVAQTWKEKKEEMGRAGEELLGLLKDRPQQGEAAAVSEITAKAFYQFVNNFDPEHGGFGSAPKFPRSHEISFLLRYHYRHKDPDSLRMVRRTLDKMAGGGIYDHLGGGFARYSTDAEWLVPHFEKMMYDQAMISRTYLEAYQAAGEAAYAEVARDIFRYVLRDMTGPEGGFYSAEDADSEGEEGKFYVWRPEEITQIVGPQQAALFNDFYGITDEGNFEHAASIPHVSRSLAEFCKERNLKEEAVKPVLALIREKLFEARKKRVPPGKDDKILTSWNAMMISSLCLGAQALGDKKYADAAARAAMFILTSLQNDGRLLRSYREGKAGIPAFQEDYAEFSAALLDLYQTTFELKWLEESVRLAEEMVRLFWDGENGGFFYAAEGNGLLVRTKEYYDGATPSGNSTAVLLLLKLARMTGKKLFEETAAKLAEVRRPALSAHPAAYTHFLAALDFAEAEAQEAVFAGGEIEGLYRAVASKYHPARLMLRKPAAGSAEFETFYRLVPFGIFEKMGDAAPAVYICENYSCRKPVTRAEDL